MTNLMTNTMTRLLTCCLAWLFVASSVFAQPSQTLQPTKQPELPAEIASTLPSTEFTGKGKLTFFGLEVYESSLWVAPSFKGSAFENHHFALELHYLRNFTAADIAKRSLEEMQRIEPVPEPKAAQWIKTLSESFPNVKKGDRIVGVHKPGFGITFWHNGKRSGEVRDADFSRQFFGIWLSPKTSEPKLRQALLGKANS
jgi:hypothetical protein